MLDAPDLPAAALDAASAAAWDAGLRVLQGVRLGPDDASHVRRLLELLDPPAGSHVLDVGCGFGEVARLMEAARPDLSFVQLNRNAGQLARADGPRVLADMHAMPLADASVDGALVLYTLCHADVPVLLAELARVVRPGGFVFVYDHARMAGDGAEAERVLCARFHPADWLMRQAGAVGLHTVWLRNAAGDDAVFRGLFHDAAAYRRIFSGLVPMAWRLVRT